MQLYCLPVLILKIWVLKRLIENNRNNGVTFLISGCISSDNKLYEKIHGGKYILSIRLFLLLACPIVRPWTVDSYALCIKCIIITFHQYIPANLNSSPMHDEVHILKLICAQKSVCCLEEISVYFLYVHYGHQKMYL